jgi:hypothetical protein
MPHLCPFHINAGFSFSLFLRLSNQIADSWLAVPADEYFDWHIPHRLNFLVAFRTRYSGDNSSRSLDPEIYRDLFRCAKDTSLLMTRFFCGELGMYCDEATHEIKDAEKWTSRFGSTRVDVSYYHAPKPWRSLSDVRGGKSGCSPHRQSGSIPLI